MKSGERRGGVGRDESSEMVFEAQVGSLLQLAFGEAGKRIIKLGNVSKPQIHVYRPE